MIYQFNDYRLDTERLELSQNGNMVDAEPQVFTLLQVLIENRHKVLSKDRLIDLIWQGRPLSDSVVSSRIKSTRKAIGDNGTAQKLIKTIHGRGFRFIGDISTSENNTGQRSTTSSPLPYTKWIDKRSHQDQNPPIIVLSINGMPSSNKFALLPESSVDDVIQSLSRLFDMNMRPEACSNTFNINTVDDDTNTPAHILH